MCVFAGEVLGLGHVCPFQNVNIIFYPYFISLKSVKQMNKASKIVISEGLKL